MCGSGRWYGSRRAIWWGSKEYRFPAKSYGWVWGIPTAWQGWAVLVAYGVGMAAIILLVSPEERPVEFFSYIGILTAALLVVCWFKGEPPKWRWGRR